jgi:hypothetical protein
MMSDADASPPEAASNAAFPAAELRRVAQMNPFAVVDFNVRDARSARLFAGFDRGIDIVSAAHPSDALSLHAEGVALRADPVWLDRAPENALQEEGRAALTTLTPEQRSHLAVRAAETENSFIAARYAHVVWRSDRREVGHGRRAVQAYLALAAAAIGSGDGREASEMLDRASQIAVVIRDPALTGGVWEATQAAADELETAYAYRWLLDLKGTVARLGRQLHGDVTASFIPRLERTVEFLASPPPVDYRARRRFPPDHSAPAPFLADRAIEQLTELRRASGDASAAARGARRRAELWEAHARALQAEAEPRVAAIMLQTHFVSAERFYREAGDIANADRVRVVIEALRERIAAEMPHYRESILVGRDELDALLQPVVGSLDIDLALARLAETDDFLPTWVEGQQHRTAQTASDALMPPINLDAALNRATSTGEDAIADARESNYYGVAMQVRQFFLHHLFQELSDRHRFTSAAVLRRIGRWPLFDSTRAPVIESAVSAYFREDYVAFIRTLMPEFEALVRYVAGTLGLPTTTPHRRSPGIDEERGLDDLLTREPAIKAALGINLWYNLHQLLVKKSGLQLRHADAHALLPSEFYSDSWANVLLVLLIRLTRADVTPASDAPANTDAPVVE